MIETTVDTTAALDAAWPLSSHATWHVFAWPDWAVRDELGWILREFGPALVEARACLYLRHDPEVDGPLEAALARLKHMRKRTHGVEQLEIIMVGGALSEPEDERLSTAMHAKISRGFWPKSPRQQRVDRMHVLELRTSRDVGRLLADQPELRPLDRFRRQFSDVPGWFQMQAIAIWDSLLTIQTQYLISGNFLEIGVWKGRSALLSTLHSTAGEECVFVDPLPLEEASEKLEAIRNSGLHYVRARSRNLVPGMLPGSMPPSYRWIHIDGEHTGIAVAHDLELASSLLGEGGIIVVDDFFSPSYPQITVAVIDYLRAHPKSLMMFLCGFNKAYLCHPSDGRWILQYVAQQLGADLAERGLQFFSLFKTTDPLDLNCFGIDQTREPGRADGSVRGPDSNEDLVLY